MKAAPYHEQVGVQLYVGEALELVSQLAPGSVDAVVTDPPYAIAGESLIANSRTVRTVKETQFFAAWLREHLREWLRVLRPDGAVWMTLDWRDCLELDHASAKLGIRRAPAIGVWDKCRMGLGGVLRRSYETFAVLQLNDFEAASASEPDLWRCAWGGGKASTLTDHPAEKPVALMERAVLLVSPRGGLVLDPFMGGGSTAIAAIRNGRRFVGFDRDPDFVHGVRQRLIAEGEQANLPLAIPEATTFERDWDEATRKPTLSVHEQSADLLEPEKP